MAAPTTAQWSERVLHDIGAPVTKNNVTALQTWLHQEQANPSEWSVDYLNPLGVSGGGLSVAPNWGSWQAGADHTASLLLSGGSWSGYGNIVAALRQDAPVSVTSQAVINSKWSGGLYARRGLAYFLGRGPLTGGAAGGASTAPTGTTHHGGGPGAIAQGFGDVLTLGGTLPGRSVIEGGTTGVVNTVKSAVGWTGELGKLLGDLTSAQWWKRVGVFSLGGFLAIGGVALFVATSKEGQRAITSGQQAVGAAAMVVK